MSNTNKHGLSRTIPENIKEIIRKEAFYGCIICGDIHTQIEHIEPEFSDCHNHDPDKMTLLCPKHHTEVTDGFITKKDIWKHKNNPFGKTNNINKKFQISSVDIKALNSHFEFDDFQNIASILDQKLFWVIKSKDNSPDSINFIIHDDEGNPAIVMNNNNLTINNKNDFRVFKKKNEITVFQKNMIVLELKISSNDISLDQINFSYKNHKIIVKNGDVKLIDKDGNESLFLLRNNHFINCGSIFSVGNTTKPRLLYSKEDYLKDLKRADGQLIGKIIKNNKRHENSKFIVDLNNFVLGFINHKNEVYSFFGKFIGHYNGYTIVLNEKEHEGIPLFILKNQILPLFYKWKYDVTYNLV